MDMNRIFLLGRLGADPVQRYTKNGIAVTHFPLATARRIRGEAQEGQEERPVSEETQWHQVVVWGRQGEICSQYLKKGRTAFLEGTVRTRKYTDKEGQERMSFEVHAEKVLFLGNGGAKKEELENGGEQAVVETEVAANA